MSEIQKQYEGVFELKFPETAEIQGKFIIDKARNAVIAVLHDNIMPSIQESGGVLPTIGKIDRARAHNCNITNMDPDDFIAVISSASNKKIEGTFKFTEEYLGKAVEAWKETEKENAPTAPCGAKRSCADCGKADTCEDSIWF